MHYFLQRTLLMHYRGSITAHHNALPSHCFNGETEEGVQCDLDHLFSNLPLIKLNPKENRNVQIKWIIGLPSCNLGSLRNSLKEKNIHAFFLLFKCEPPVLGQIACQISGRCQARFCAPGFNYHLFLNWFKQIQSLTFVLITDQIYWNVFALK